MQRVPTVPTLLCALVCVSTSACFDPPDTPLTGETTTGPGDTTAATTVVDLDTSSSSSVGATTVVDPDTTVGPPGSTSSDSGEPTTGGAPEIEVSIDGVAVASGESFDVADAVAVGEQGPLLTVTVENIGTSDLLIDGVLAMGPDATHVAIDQAGLAASIAAGESSSFTVVFAPQNGGQKNVVLSIGNDDDDESPYALSLRGRTPSNTYRLITTVGSPSPRFNATLDDLGDGRLLLFGGRDAMGAQLGDTWVFEVETDTWTQLDPGVSPPARNAHGMALLEAGTVIMFGGSTSMGGGALGDTWSFDVAAETWTQVAGGGPPARLQHELVAIGNARAVLYGGRTAGGGTEISDTWMFDAATGTWTNMAPAGGPPAVSAYAMAFDGDDTLTRFGGLLNNVPVNQTWNYTISNNSWAQAATMGNPGARAVLSGEYLAAGQMIVFSGKLNECCVDPTGGTFAYDRMANTWTTITPPGEPSPRFGYAMTRVAGNKSIFFGGLLQNTGVGTAQGQTWEYVGPQP